MPQADGAIAQGQEKAQEAASQAKEQAQQAAGQAKSQVRGQVDQRSTQAGQQVTQQADDIRTVAQQLREQGKDKPAELAEKAAERAERVGSYLTQSDADRILNDVEDFARQRPWAVVAGGLALGFAASRFLKASGTQRYQSTMQQRQGTGYTPTPAIGYGTGAGVAAGASVPVTPASTGPDERIGTAAGRQPVENELSGGVPSTAPPTAPTTPGAPVTGGL